MLYVIIICAPHKNCTSRFKIGHFPPFLLAKLDCMDKCNYIQKDLHDSYVFNQDKIQHPLLSKEDKDVDKNIYSPGYNFLYIYIHTHIYSSVCNYT